MGFEPMCACAQTDFESVKLKVILGILVYVLGILVHPTEDSKSQQPQGFSAKAPINQGFLPIFEPTKKKQIFQLFGENLGRKKAIWGEIGEKKRAQNALQKLSGSLLLTNQKQGDFRWII